MGLRPDVRRPLDEPERDLLAQLVRDMGPRLLAYVQKVYRGTVDPEDVVAETFCRAARNITALRASSRQDLYLITTARNLCRDGYRRPRHADLDDGYGAAAAVADSADPGESASDRERVRRLRAAVADLPESLREIVVLRMSADLKFEEISRLLKIPLGTALSRMHTALERVRCQLGPDDAC